MQTRLLMTASAVLMAAAGGLGTFLPDEILRYGRMTPEKGAALMVQLIGGLYLALATLDWTARGNLMGGIYARPVVLANFAYFWIATLTMARAVSTGGGPLVAALAIHAVLAVWFALVLFGGTPTAAEHG